MAEITIHRALNVYLQRRSHKHFYTYTVQVKSLDSYNQVVTDEVVIYCDHKTQIMELDEDGNPTDEQTAL